MKSREKKLFIFLESTKKTSIKPSGNCIVMNFSSRFTSKIQSLMMGHHFFLSANFKDKNNAVRFDHSLLQYFRKIYHLLLLFQNRLLRDNRTVFSRKFWQGRKWKKTFLPLIVLPIVQKNFEGDDFRIIISPLLFFHKKKEPKSPFTSTKIPSSLLYNSG